jgi:AcrR family transcriptional regulator
MGQRVGITEQAVVEAAARLVDSEGLQALTLTGVAATLGIRTPSLYAHVDSLDDLRRRLAIAGVKRLAAELESATHAKSGRDALDAIAATYRWFALEHPGQYRATLRDPGDDHELRAANQSALDVFVDVLREVGVPDRDLMHCYRALWSALHGFNELLATGVMSMPTDVTLSYERIVDIFMAYVSQPKAKRPRQRGRPSHATS